MNDPVAILLIVVLVGAAVALWMLDGTYRSRLLKTSKRASDAEEKSTKLKILVYLDKFGSLRTLKFQHFTHT